MAIKAKHTTRCGRCGKWIQAGVVLIEWDGKTACHATEDDCARTRADVEIPPAPADPEAYWREFERIGLIFLRQRYRIATSMPGLPHAYALHPENGRKPTNWQNTTEFEAAVFGLRMFGRRKRWGRSNYKYLYINEYYYWVCVDDDTVPPWDGLINKAYRNRYEQPRFPMVSEPAPIDFGQVVDVTGLSVLDIGCTASHLALQAGSYVAIGSEADKVRFPAGGKTCRFIDTSLSEYVPVQADESLDTPPDGSMFGEAQRPEIQRFDIVVVGDGVMDGLTQIEATRLPLLARDGGIIVGVGTDSDRWRWSETVEIQGHTVGVTRLLSA